MELEPLSLYIEVPERPFEPDVNIESERPEDYRAGDYRPIWKDSILVGFEVFYYYKSCDNE